MTRYTATRYEGAWRVVDGETAEIVETTGAGKAGAEAALHAVVRWNASRSTAAVELRAWRKAHKLSQAALASQLGVAWLTVQRWEAGTRGVPPYLHLALRHLECMEEHPS